MLQTFSSCGSSAAIFDALARDGGVIVEDLLTPRQVDGLSADFESHLDAAGELMTLGGGETPQVFHRDADSWHHYPAPRPEILVSANVALTDFSAENGATVVVPGSHTWPRERQAKRSEEVSAVMSKGSAPSIGQLTGA